MEDQLGPEVIHIYDVKNKGPATIKEAEVFIMWPSFTKGSIHKFHAKKELKYLFLLFLCMAIST